jgi:Flp pilus assembly protein CpaB
MGELSFGIGRRGPVSAVVDRPSPAAPAPPRRRQSLSERVTVGHVAPVVLAVFAGVFVLGALRDRSATALVAVANGPISAGAAVDGSDTRLVRVHAHDSGLRAGLLPAADLGRGWVAAVRIGAGDAITRSEVVHAGPGGGGLGSMSIPVAVSHAAGGSIVAGDRVDVIAENGAGSQGSAGAQYVGQGLQVLAVSSSKTPRLLATTNGDYYVVVAVDRATALRLTAALASSSGVGGGGNIEVVRTTGEPPQGAGGTPAAGGGG